MEPLAPERPLLSRMVVSAAFVLVVASFFLPFLSATVDERAGRATGSELATGTPQLEGRYVHEAYKGGVEGVFDRGRTPSLVALVLAAAGIALAWLPWRLGPAAALALAATGLLAMLGVHQRTTSPWEIVDIHIRYGFWLSGVLFAVAGASGSALFRKEPFWWKPPSERPRDYFAALREDDG